MPISACISSSSTSTATPTPTKASEPSRPRPKIITTPPRGVLRQQFHNYLTLRHLADRTIGSYTGWIYQLAKFHRRSPDELGNAELQAWFLHLIAEGYSASSLNLAINAVRSFFGGMLGRDVEPLLKGIRRPRRHHQPPQVFSPEEIETLLTQGTAGDPLARIFLMTVYGCGLRLSEAIAVQIEDIVTARHQLRVSQPKGGRQRLVPLSDNLLKELRAWYRVHKPVKWLFSQGHDQPHINRSTGQNLYYRSRNKAGLKNKNGIHSLRHSFATHFLENGVEITAVQQFLGHASIVTTARYLHLREARLGQIHSPLGLLRTGP